jgi:hypothetical protein
MQIGAMPTAFWVGMRSSGQGHGTYNRKHPLPCPNPREELVGGEERLGHLGRR